MSIICRLLFCQICKIFLFSLEFSVQTDLNPRKKTPTNLDAGHQHLSKRYFFLKYQMIIFIISMNNFIISISISELFYEFKENLSTCISLAFTAVILSQVLNTIHFPQS